MTKQKQIDGLTQQIAGIDSTVQLIHAGNYGTNSFQTVIGALALLDLIKQQLGKGKQELILALATENAQKAEKEAAEVALSPVVDTVLAEGAVDG